MQVGRTGALRGAGRRVAAALFVTLLLTVPLGPVTLPHRSNAPIGSGTGTPVPMSGSTPTINAYNLRYTVSTLVVANGSLLKGNSQSVLNGFRPTAGALDTRTNTVAFTDIASGTISLVNTSTDRLVATSPMSLHPDGIAYDPATNALFVSRGLGGNVTVLNATTLRTVASVTVGSTPLGAVFDPHNTTVFVAVSGAAKVSVLSGSSNRLLLNVTVGTTPTAIAYDSRNDLIAVTNLGSNTVSVFNATTYRSVASVRVGTQPDGVAYDAKGGAWLVSNRGSSNVSIVNATTSTLVGSTGVGSAPGAVAYDNVTAAVYVANNASNNLSVLNGATFKVSANIPVGLSPAGVVFDSKVSELFVSEEGEAAIAVVSASTNKVVGTALVGSDPDGISWDSSDQFVLVSDSYSNDVVAVNESNEHIMGLAAVGLEPRGISFDTLDDRVYVADVGSNAVSAVSEPSNTVSATIPVGSTPVATAYNGINGTVFVANAVSANLTMISAHTETTIGSAYTGSGPSALAYDANRNVVYVANFAGNNVTVTSGSNGAYRGGWKVGTLPLGIASDSTNYTIFTANSMTNNVTVFSVYANAVIATIPVGHTPDAVAYNDAGNVIFVANEASDNVSVIDPATNKVTASIPVGLAPNALTYDTSTNRLYVSDGTTGTLSIVQFEPPLTYNLSFREKGLPSGTNWNVSVDGTVQNSTTPWINVSVVNGTYSYLLGGVAGYTTTWNGSATVAAATTVVNVTFTRVYYAVAFQETGLPAGTAWNVTVNGVVNTSIAGTIGFELPNGTFAYSIQPIPGLSAAWRGNVTLRGAGATVSVTFSRVLYDVEFEETGLPTGTPWSIVLGGTAYSNASSTIRVSEPNGSFGYVISNIPGYHESSVPYSGSVTVQGASPAPLVLDFSQVSYLLTFSEIGLPVGTPWTISWPGQLVSGSTSSLVAPVPNGTIDYRIAGVPGYSTNYTGVVTVDGGGAFVQVDFTLTTWLVAFEEAGLSNGTAWTVTIDNQSATSTSSAVLVALPNGTWAYRISPIAGYTADWQGSVTVANGSSNASILFVRVTYLVDLIESGLPVNTVWSVTIGGSVLRTDLTTISLDEPNGTFNYSVGSVPGYAASPSKGKVDISGAAATVPIPFSAVTYSTRFDAAGLPAGTNWSIHVVARTSGSTVATGVGGTVWSDGSGTIAVRLSNGTFTFTAAATGYTAPAGAVTINGALPFSLSIPFTANAAPSGFLGGAGGSTEVVLIVAIVAAAAIAIALLSVRRRRSPPSAAPEPSRPPPELD